MKKGRHTRHKLDPLMLLAVMVTVGVMITSTASAEEPSTGKPGLADLQDGDITLVTAKHGGAAIHMSFLPPSVVYGNNESDQVLAIDTLALPDLYLSVRLSW